MAMTMVFGTLIAVAMAGMLAPVHSQPAHLTEAPRVLLAAANLAPIPQRRPRDREREAAGDGATDTRPPLPRPRPDPPEPAAHPAVAETTVLSRLTPHEHAVCMSGLREAGIAAEVLPPIHEDLCGMRWPLRLAEIGDGGAAIDVTPPARVRCPVAEALAQWMATAVQPAAQEHLGRRVTGLRIAGSYECRARNHVPGARLSEHAIGNAIDIAAFRIGGEEWLAVGPREDEDASDAQFLTEVRNAACTYFHTVLGPGSDPFHSDHFHLDLARRGKTGTRRFCR
jgi:hypothetical protein